MNRFEQIERLFEQGTALPPDGRAAFLDAHTAGDPALRAEVEELLRASASANANPAWEHGALSNATPAPHPAFDAPSGFAQYRILETIGVGGMGTVYRALRTGENMEQVVAIKILHAPASGAAAGYRFEQERRILARLDHPDIARLLDCGATPDGRPFLVMDYVHGVTITQYLGNTNLTIAQRTELFLAICAVVSYIHRNLVAHRDIKPGNILVTPEGTPKLLDFGIATLLDGSALRTLTGNAALTPEYASPEQVQGLPAGPASDIYSLGVVFYQMLTGHLPYNPQPGPLGLANAITQAPPVRPRTHVPSIPADLEYILLKALRKEPARRYESVEQLSADLQRFRKSFPVSARPDSFAYRLARALHRNRVWAAAATLVIAAIIAGSAIAIRQSNRRFAEIRKIAEVLTRELDDSIYDIGGTAQARRLILQRGAEYLNAIAGERGNDRAVALDLADAYQRFATLQGVNQLNVGDHSGAIDTLQRSESTLAPLAARNPKDLEIGRRLAEVQSQLIDLFNTVGDLRSAQTYAQKAIATSKQLLPLKPRDPDLAMSLGSAYESLADLSGNPAYSNLGDTAAALNLYDRCLPFLSAVAADDSNPDARQPLAGLHLRIGKVYQYALGDYDQALEHFTTAAQISDSIRRRKSNRWTELNAGIRYRFVAAALQSLGRAGQARARAAESLAILEAVDKSFPGVPSFQRETALSITMLGSFDAEAGDHAKAVDQYRRTLKIFDSLIATQASYAADLGYRDTWRALAASQLALGDAASVMQSAQAQLTIDDRLLAICPDNADALENRSLALEQAARAHAALHQPADAKAAYSAALEILKSRRATGKLPPVAATRIPRLEQALAAF